MGQDQSSAEHETPLLDGRDIKGDPASPPRVEYSAIIKVFEFVASVGPHDADDFTKDRLARGNELLKIYEYAINRAGAAPRAVRSESPAVVQFEMESADQTIAVCHAWLERNGELNRALGRKQQRRSVAAIDVRRYESTGVTPSAADELRKGHELAQSLDDLVKAACPGQMCISNEIYDAIASERRIHFEPIEGTGVHRGKRVWIRRVVENQALCTEGALLNVDMARYRMTERSLTFQLRDSTAASRMLKQQIETILMGGFASVGLSYPYEDCVEQSAGDGTVLMLPTVRDAHAVALGILRKAEEFNTGPRRDQDNAALRCFRIGISRFNTLDAHRGSEPTGESFAQAKRLQEWGPTGEIRITEEAYLKLPTNLQIEYGGPEQIPGKQGEPATPARRYAPAPRAPWKDRSEQEYPPITPNPEPSVAPVSPIPRQPCFVVTPLKDEPRINEVYQKLILPACRRAGFEPVRATQISGLRNEAIPQHLQESPMVIAYLGVPHREWNPNVILEIGFRMATKRPMVILGDAHPGGATPDYQATLPFQLVHHNIITVMSNPTDSLQTVTKEILHSSSSKDRSEWDTPLPFLEVRFTNFEDVTVTDFNDAAVAVFGKDNLKMNGDLTALSAMVAKQSDPRATEARREEWYMILAMLNMWHRNRTGKQARAVPQARVPIVFTEAPINPTTGKPDGYLPVVVRYSLDGIYIQARFLYIKVSASMRFDEKLGYHICDL